MGLEIVAIGGGSILEGETRSIDLEFIGRTGKSNPRALFVPTATEDNEEYAAAFTRGYGGYGCSVDILRLLSCDRDPDRIASKIAGADLIYVGGGNTKAMLEVWRELGVDAMLREAANRGAVLGGTSAGAICWFRMGNNDWPQYEGIPGIMTAPLVGLGFVDLILCPHCSRESFRLGDFRRMMADVGGVGIGLDDGCAIQVSGDRYRILDSLPGAVAHRIEAMSGNVQESVLEPHADFRSLSSVG